MSLAAGERGGGRGDLWSPPPHTPGLKTLTLRSPASAAQLIRTARASARQSAQPGRDMYGGRFWGLPRAASVRLALQPGGQGGG